MPNGACVNACAPISTRHFNGVAAISGGGVVATALVGLSEGNHLANGEVDEFDSAGDLLSSSPPEPLEGPAGIAVDNESGVIYVGAGPQFKSTVRILGPLVTTPNATTGSAAGVTSAGAVLHGTVGADGGPAATCKFQYVTAETFQDSGFTGAPTAPCEPAGPFTGSGEEEVTASISGLDGGTSYRFRLLATNENGTTTGGEGTLKTPGPSVLVGKPESVSGVSAVLGTSINPNGQETTYRFFVVDQAHFEQGGFASAELTALRRVS